MTDFACGLTDDVDLLVFADWLEDQGKADVATLVRQAPEELRRVAETIAHLKEKGRVKPTAIRVRVTTTISSAKITLYRFTALDGNTGRGLRGHGVSNETNQTYQVVDCPALCAMAYAEHAEHGAKSLVCQILAARHFPGKQKQVVTNTLADTGEVFSYEIV